MQKVNLSFINSLFNTPQTYGIQVSHDLKWVAWTWANITPTANVYIAPTDGSKDPVQLTNIDQDVYIESWTFDSKYLVIGYDNDGDERVKLFQIDINKPNKLKLLNDEKPQYFTQGGMLDPSNRYVIYGANYNFQKNKVIEQTFIYRHDLKNGERKILAAPKKAGYICPALNSKGTHIIYNRNDIDPSGSQVWLVDIKGKQDREILNFGSCSKVGASWFPDGERIVFVAEQEKYRKVGIWHLKDSKIEWVLDDPERNLEGAYVPCGSESIVILETRNAQTVAFLYDLYTKQEIVFSNQKNLIPLAQLSQDTWITRYFNSKQPTDIVLYNTKSKSIQKNITNIWTKVSYSSDKLTQAEDFWWEGVDKKRIQGWLYRSKKKAKGTIVFVHGGPTAHSEDRFNLDIQFFVSQGFNVLDPNYRGSTGFNLNFQELIKKDGWGGKEQEDIIRGIKELIKQGIAEPNKVGITGTSYGGYSSWYAITHNSKEIIAASAPICGMTDLVVDYYSTRPDLRVYSEEMLGGSPKDVPDRYYERSPINFVKNIEGKLLIIQGTQDPNVTPENVKAVEKQLKKFGIQYETMIFDDEGHGISKPLNKKVLLIKLADFFSKSFNYNLK